MQTDCVLLWIYELIHRIAEDVMLAVDSRRESNIA